MVVRLEAHHRFPQRSHSQQNPGRHSISDYTGGSLLSELWTLASASSEEMSWLAELYWLTEAALAEQLVKFTGGKKLPIFGINFKFMNKKTNNIAGQFVVMKVM